MPCSGHHIKDTYDQHDLSLMIRNSLIWLRLYLLGFSIVKLLFFLSFHAVLFGRKSLCLACSKGVRSYAVPPERAISA